MIRRRAAAALMALLLVSCSVGPDYDKPPPVATTPAFKEASPEAVKGAGDWKPAAPADRLPRTRWWETFNDPDLNALEAQIDGENQDLKIAEARFREARAVIGYARAAEFPTISVAPMMESLRYSNHRPYFSHTHTTGDFQMPLDVTYEVDLWGKIRRSVEAAGDAAQASAADLQTVSLSLHAELAMDYFELRSADAMKALLDQTVKAYSDALELTENRVKGGIAPESDTALARTQLEATRVQATDTTIRRARYEHAIATLIGKPPAAFSLPAKSFDLRLPTMPVGVPSDLLQRRPDIASAERRVAQANEQIGIAKAAYYPSLVLSPIVGEEGTGVYNWFGWGSIFWAVGGTLTQTVFDGGRRSAANAAALANYDAAVANYRETTLDAFQQVEDYLATLRILDVEAQQQDAAVTAARDAVRLSNDRYRGGRDTYLLVITAQAAALLNERNAVDITRRRMEADVLLVKALGGGWDTGSLPTQDQLKSTETDTK